MAGQLSQENIKKFIEAAKAICDAYEELERKNQNTVPNGQKPVVTLEYGGKQYVIGGPNKIDLYSLHTSNLRNVIRYLENATDSQEIANMLVSMTTGSGKTFTQALIIMATHMAGLKGCFVVPDKLKAQFESDLPRLIPDAMLKDIFGDKPESRPNPQTNRRRELTTEELIRLTPAEIRSRVCGNLNETNEANERNTTKNIQIFGHSEFLIKEYNKVRQLDPSNTILSFDEAHLLADKELAFTRSTELASSFTNFYLSATPTPSLLELGRKIGAAKASPVETVANMTNAEKVKGGYAMPTQAFEKKNPSMSKLDQQTGHHSFIQRINRWLGRVIDSAEPKNLANTVLEQYLYGLVTHQDQKTTLELPAEFTDLQKLQWLTRWKIQPAAAQGKTLICTNHFDDIINLSRQLDDLTTSYVTNTFYANKNIYSTDRIFRLLQINPSPDVITVEKYKAHLIEQFKQKTRNAISLLANEHGLKVSEPDIELLAQQLIENLDPQNTHAPINNSKHAMVDLALSLLAARENDTEVKNLGFYLANFGGKYLDMKRRENLPEFLRQIVNTCRMDTSGLRQYFLRALTFDAQRNSQGVPVEIAEPLANILLDIAMKLASTDSDDGKLKIVNNSYVDHDLFKELPQKTRQSLDDLAKAHFKYLYFSEINDNEGLKNGKTMTGVVLDPNNTREKIRTQRPIEALDANFKPTHFIGLETPLSTNMVDNLFRIGLTSVLVTDTKIEGFSDPNLHSVFMVAHDTDDKMSDPTNIVQGYGRNRGLNPAKTPQFNFICPDGMQTVFGVSELNRDDYTADYYTSLKKYKKTVIRNLGKKLGDDILVWVKNNSNASGDVDSHAFENEMIDMCFNIMEEINKQNAYKFSVTKDDFLEVLHHSMDYLNSKHAKLAAGTTIPLLPRVVGFLMYLVSYVKFAIAQSRAISTFKAAFQDEDSKEMALYKKIILTTNPANIWHQRTSTGLYIKTISACLEKNRDYYQFDSVKKRMSLSPTQFLDIRKIHESRPNINYITASWNLRAVVSLLEMAGKYDPTKPDEMIRWLETLGDGPVELNPNHPDEKKHLNQINWMFYGQSKRDPMSGKLEYHLRASNIKEALKEIRAEDLALNPKIIFLAQRQDLHSSVEKLVEDKNFLDAMKFIQTTFKTDELALLLGDGWFGTKTRELEEFIKDMVDAFTREDLKNTHLILQKYYTPVPNSPNATAPEDIIPPKIVGIMQSLSTVFDALNQCHRQFYGMDCEGTFKDPNAIDLPRALMPWTDTSRNKIKENVVSGVSHGIYQSWRRTFLLRHLEQELPNINQNQYRNHSSALKTAMTESFKVFNHVFNEKKTAENERESVGVKIRAGIFSEEAEGTADLGEYSSRVARAKERALRPSFFEKANTNAAGPTVNAGFSTVRVG